MKIDHADRAELINAIVDWQIHTFMSGQNLSDLRDFLMNGHGYDTRDGWRSNSRNHWSTKALREYAKTLGIKEV